MELNIRKVSNYMNLSVEEGSMVIECGLLDSNEQVELAQHLRDVADELDPQE